VTAALLSGLLLGLSSGLSPGPLFTLVLAQTLRHGPREGCRVALAPLLTDLPIILLALGLATRLSALQTWLGILGCIGGAYVLYLAVESLRAKAAGSEAANAEPRSWRKGVLTNLLNPSPWLFWITVGAPTLARALAESPTAAAAFIIGFYLLLVGSKLLLAVVAGRSRSFLSGRVYRRTLQALGLLLAAFAVSMFREAWKLLVS
jgi:threonine/homoserine/homoserine lactone efflux protein